MIGDGASLPVENSDGQRTIGRPFPKGTSGNPGGRPKELRELEAALFVEFAPKVRDAMERLYQLVMTGPDKSAPAAAKLFIERLMGAPVSHRADAGEDEAASRLADEDFWATVLQAPAVRDVVLRVIEGGKR